MSLKGIYGTDYEERVDFDALRRDRLKKTRDAMAKFGADVLLLSKPANSRYVSGSRSLDLMSRGPGLPQVMLVPTEEAPYLWFFARTDVPDWIPSDHIHPLTWHPVKHIGRIANILGEALKGKVAVDAAAPYFLTTLNAMVPGITFVDGNQIMEEARRVKTPEEIECLRIAHVITETAVSRVLAKLQPGLRDIDMHGLFLEEIARWGETFPISAGVYASQPKERAKAPWVIDGKSPYRHMAQGGVFGEGEMVTIETGTFYLGYTGLFGRTWYCGRHREPRPQEKDLYKRWDEAFQRVAEQCRPGRTGADLYRAAGAQVREAPRYLVHGVGIGFEPPVVGGGLGPGEEWSWVLEPGMVLTVAPYVWQEGVGGFRASETLLITPDGHERLTHFPHGPLAD